jgi:hypothetical protein
MQDVEYIGNRDDEKWLPRPYKNRGKKETKIRCFSLRCSFQTVHV